MIAPNLVRLTRRVSFSSGHRYWIPDLTDEENRSLFGKWASPYNHGHNYVLDVTAEGEVDPQTGMVVNIKWIDDVLKDRILSRFDQKSINDEIEHFRTRSSSLENLLLYIRDQLEQLPGSARLVHLRLQETSLLWAELDTSHSDPTNWKMTLTRTYEFAASHRLYNPGLSEDENEALYGKCRNPAGHGHNYLLEVTVEGKPDERSGMMVDLEKLDQTVERLVVDRFDHKNLNVDLPEFQGKLTTSEVVAQEIWRLLDGNLPANLDRIRLHETARNVFELSRQP